MPRRRLEGLDALRGMAAVSVAVFHTAMLTDIVPVVALPGWFTALYIAVPLFFAISAFSLCAGYYDRLSSAAALKAFYVRRFLRVAPLFYVMIVVWVLSLSYLWRAWKIPEIADLALNVLFLFNFIPSKAGSLVPAGWSLGVEMIFYAVFPLLIMFMRGIATAATSMVVFCVIAVTVAIMTRAWGGGYAWFSVLSQAPFFVAGIGLFHIYLRLEGRIEQDKKWIAVGLFALTAAMLIALKLSGVHDVKIAGWAPVPFVATTLHLPLLGALPNGFLLWPEALTLLSRLGADEIVYAGWHPGPHLVGLALLPLVFSFALHGFRFLVNPVTVFLGAVSYGVYLIHPLIIVFVRGPVQEAMSGANQWGTLAVVAVVVLGISTLLASVTYFGLERPVMLWRPSKASSGPGVLMAAK